MGQEDWLEDDRFAELKNLFKNKSLAKKMFSRKIKSMLLRDICLCLDEYDLTHGVVEDLTSIVQDAHLIENGIITSTESEDPSFKWTVANPIIVSGEMTRPVSDPPYKGQHTRCVLEELGFSADEIDQLFSDGAVF